MNVRFVTEGDVTTMRRQVEYGTWTLERPLATGRYSYELWAVDAMGNRSSTLPGGGEGPWLASRRPSGS